MAVRSSLSTVMSDVPTPPVDVSSPSSLTVRTDVSLDAKATAWPPISRPDASTTAASSWSVPSRSTAGAAGVTAMAAGTRGPRSSPHASRHGGDGKECQTGMTSHTGAPNCG